MTPKDTNSELRQLDAIIKTVKSNKRTILYTQVIGRDSDEWCNRDDLWAISTEELAAIKTIVAAQKQRWEAEARIDEAEYWWSDIIPATNNAVIKRAEDRRRKLYAELVALDGVIGGQTGNTAVTMPVGELPDVWGHDQSDTERKPTE